MGLGATLLKGQIKVDRVFLAVAGAFLLLELSLPVIGAVGYRRPVDFVSALRMAMLWLPMVFLTLLAPSWRSVQFEESLAKLLAVTLWLNLAYAVLQVAAAIGVVPRQLLITEWLQPWAVDHNYNVIQGLRPAGFFNNSTALSVFGIVCLCFFYARHVSSGSRKDLVRALIAIGIVVLSTSRAAYAACAAIVFAGWWHLSSARKVMLGAILIAGGGGLLILVQETIGVEVAFSRFQRLADSGLLEDESFGARVYQIWPAALQAARDYTFGTLIQAPRALPLVDSGYLTYYLQGKWPFVAALAALLSGFWYFGLRAFFGPKSQRFGILALFLAIYLTGALLISNPLRSPSMIFFLIFALWRLSAERDSRLMQLRAVVNASNERGTGLVET
jgi:hypothetical protein